MLTDNLKTYPEFWKTKFIALLLIPQANIQSVLNMIFSGVSEDEKI